MYKCLNNKDQVYKSTGGMDMTVSSKTEYSVYWVKDGHKLHILDIRDYFQDPKGIGEGVCKSLNKGEVVLNLEV